MKNKHRLISAFYALSVIVLVMTGCNPDFHKADADKEVYKIIDTKWQDKFGQKTNYIISDSNISSPNDVNVDKTPVFEEPLTLAQAVAIATKYNRDYQFQKEELYLQALTLTEERYKYALKWLGTIDYEYTKNGSSPEDRTIKSEVGTSKTFLTPDGILLNTSLVFDWARFLTGDPRTTLSGVLSGTLDIPLLGNGGGKTAWENLTQTERNVLYQIRTFNRYRQTFVVDTITAYYGVLQNKDGVTNAKNNWNSSVEYRKQAEMEAKTGRTAPYEVDQARQRELSAYDSYVITLQLYEQSLDSFKIRLSLPVNTTLELDQNELRSLRNYGTTAPQYTIDNAIETALSCRLDLANFADAVEDAQRKVKLASEGLGPKLDLTGSANVNSQGNEHIDNFQFHKGTYNWGLSADLPFDRKNQRNAYRQALITLQQQQRAYSQSVDSVVQDVRQAYRQLMATAEQFVTQKKSLAIAEERVKNMPLLLKSGRAKTRDLLDAQDSLLLAQNDLTSALVGHTIAKLSFYRDVGILQVKPDGMWTQSVIVSKDQANEREQSKQSSKDNL
ncbi:MAG: TolC family protein [Sedimentisphaerales bacterium]|jgi:outer membrane protein TolC